MHGNAAIAVIFVCVILGCVGLYYALKTACMKLIYKTMEVRRKDNGKVEMVPPAAAAV